uniref:Uncharacterized protein n=1 Tax=Anopheles albimanus TaxID=7167 RepID=A0A182F480_ANOAL
MLLFMPPLSPDTLDEQVCDMVRQCQGDTDDKVLRSLGKDTDGAPETFVSYKVGVPLSLRKRKHSTLLRDVHRDDISSTFSIELNKRPRADNDSVN